METRMINELCGALRESKYILMMFLKQVLIADGENLSEHLDRKNRNKPRIRAIESSKKNAQLQRRSTGLSGRVGVLRGRREQPKQS